MASKIKVDQIEGSTGSSITIPTGQTLTVADGIASTSLTGTINDARLPTVPVSKGGTGLTSLGTAGQAIKVNSGGNALEFGTIASGTYSVHAIDTYRATTQIGQTTSTDYKDIADGNTVQFTPTSTNDFIQFSYTCGITPYTGMGMNTYLMMSTNSTIGSSDTKLDYDGKDIGMFTGSSAGQVKATKSKTFIMPCTNLTVGTTYYVEQAGSSNFNGNWGYWNSVASNATGDFNNHYVSMVHYKA
jgi:outer membrane protein W